MKTQSIEDLQQEIYDARLELIAKEQLISRLYANIEDVEAENRIVFEQYGRAMLENQALKNKLATQK